MPDVNWSEVIKNREQATPNLPNILKMPAVEGRMDILKNIIKEGDSILDIGAYDRTLEKLLDKTGIKVRYFSFDVDKTMPHDFYDLDGIDQTFDIVTAFEVIEHVTPAQIIDIFNRASKLLKKGGFLVVSTPNVCHPVHFWRSCMHITPVRHDELYNLLLSAGFKDIRIYRAGKLKWKEKLWAFIYRPLIKLLKMDFMPSIIATARPNK